MEYFFYTSKCSQYAVCNKENILLVKGRIAMGTEVIDVFVLFIAFNCGKTESKLVEKKNKKN